MGKLSKTILKSNLAKYINPKLEKTLQKYCPESLQRSSHPLLNMMSNSEGCKSCRMAGQLDIFHDKNNDV